MKERRFKVGDKITYKSTADCVGFDGDIKRYYWGGTDIFGFVGTVKKINRFVEEKDCYEIEVSTNGLNGSRYMLESEFLEYENKRIKNNTNEFKNGDLIKRDKGKVVYRFLKYDDYGRHGDMHVEQTETKRIYTLFSHHSDWVLVSNVETQINNEFFPIY